MLKAYTYFRWKRHILWTKCNIAPMEKTLWHQWYTSSKFIATIEKPASYKRFFFEVVITMINCHYHFQLVKVQL